METTPNGKKARTPGLNGEHFPIVLTEDLQHADAVLALRSHPKLKSLVQEQNLPIYGLKSNSLAQISRTLKQILGLDDPKNRKP